MRSPSHPPLGTRTPRCRLLARSGRDCWAAEALLGVQHPLVRLVQRLQVAVEQVMAVAALEVVACVLMYSGAPAAAPLAMSAAVVQAALGVRLAVLLERRRELCLGLIIEGLGRLPLAAVEREWRRLEDPRHRERLARSLEDMVDVAQGPLARVPGSRPIFDVRVIRLVGPQLRDVVGLLRADAPDPPGVALVERLTSCGVSPLYGGDVELLREELRRARYLLAR